MRYSSSFVALAAPLAMAWGALTLSGCFLDGEGHMQPGASDATPDAFRPFDGGMVDAFVPEIDGGTPADAGPMDADITGEDGGVPMDAVVPMDAFVPDAGTDAGPPDTGPPDTGPPDTGPPDTGPPDTGPPPLRTCEELYGSISGVTVCPTGSATRCRLFYESDNDDCEDVCHAACVHSYNNAGSSQCMASGDPVHCETDRYSQICICERTP